MRRLRERHQPQADFATFSFHIKDVVKTPIDLMATLYEQLPKPPAFLRREVTEVFKVDPFGELYETYQRTLHQLGNQPLSGRKAVEPDQINAVRQVLRGASTLGLPILTQGAVDPATAGTASETVMNVTTTALSVFDLIAQHPATQKDRELRELMLEPLPKLTQAFIESLRQRAAKRPLVLVLDTFEKAPPSVDTWLCSLLLPTPGLKSQPIRWVIAGRYHLTDKELWRKLQQDLQLLNGSHGQRLKRFTEDQTRDYLQQVVINDPSEIQAIYQKTKGLPYYLNRVRETSLKGKPVDLTQDIGQLFFPGLNTAQTQMLQRVACCRWFDKPLVEQLAEHQGLGLQISPDDSLDWFEWLKRLDFLDPAIKPYGLDDVARETLRALMHTDDREAFYQTHEWLAAYFETQANRVVAADQPEPEKYNDAEWCRYTIEVVYHTLFSRRKDCQPQFLTHLFAACYLNQIQVVIEPVQSIAAEAAITTHRLLPSQTQKFLTNLESVVLAGGWAVFDTSPNQYEMTAEHLNLDKTQVETALQSCLSRIDALEGLAKFAALFYKSKRCPESQRVEWLLKANAQAEQIVTPTDPDFSSSLFLWTLGNEFDELGRYEEAIKSYDKALEFKPDKHEAWYNRGVSLHNLGHYKEAIASDDKALEIKPDLHEAWYNRGISLHKLGRDEAAIESFDKALEIKLDKHEAWYNRGVALNNLESYDAAIESYDKALEIKPDDHDAWNNRGNSLHSLGHYDAAIESYDKAIEIKPNYHGAWNNRGNSLHNLRRYDEAILSYDKAVEIKPDYHEAWYNRGNSLHNLGRYDEALTKFCEAIASYDKALEFKPDKHEAWTNRGVLLGNLGRYDEAVKSYDHALEVKPNDQKAWYNRGVLLGNLGRYDEAVKSYNHALEVKPDYHEAWYNRGFLLHNLGRYDEASASYDKSLEFLPDDAWAYYNKARCYGLLGQIDLAVETLQHAIALDSECRELAKTDSDFDGIRDDERFQVLVNSQGT